jgi:uncharacterized protein (TIGR02271 family)
MATKKTRKTVIGVFENRAAAERAVASLKADGYKDDQIGLIGKDSAGASQAGKGAAIGAGVGAVATAGIGAAVMTGIIPVVGPVLALGPIAATLINLAGGAAGGGLAGALVGYGIPDEDAKFYENELKAGRYLVTVDACDRVEKARTIYAREGGYDRATAPAGRTMQVKEEELRATKEPVKAGEVKVRKEVRTEHKQIAVPVEREEVVVERRPARGSAASGDIKAEEIRIPTKEEKVRVTKQPVVKEEVSVEKRKVHDTKTVSGDLRKEDVVVETDGGAKARQAGRAERK